MRAIQVSEFGGPEVLELVDLPEPEPASHQARIRVTACGINYADTHQAADDYLAPQKVPFVPGGEVVGMYGIAEDVTAVRRFVVEILTEAGGADVILDNMGAKYLERNVTALATEGRLVVIGMQGGSKGELDLGALLRKRGAVIATTLRARPSEEKSAICAAVVEHVWPLVGEGKLRAVVHEHVPLEQASRAHELMESGSHSGKILLTTGG